MKFTVHYGLSTLLVYLADNVQFQAPRGSEKLAVRKERTGRAFGKVTFGRDSKYQRPYDLADSSQASPPSSGQSRNGKQSRNFLSGLRRKGKGDTQGSSEKDIGTSPG